MSLQEIASISGKPGLYKVVKPTRTGIILETIDEKKKKVVANANSRVSLLKEISIYTTSQEGSILLEQVLLKIKEVKGDTVEPISDEKALFAFLGQVVPDYDADRVYPSDIKKLISWFNTLNKYFPELIAAPLKEPKPKATEKKVAEKKSTEKKVAEKKPVTEKKAAAKKPAAKK